MEHVTWNEQKNVLFVKNGKRDTKLIISYFGQWKKLKMIEKMNVLHWCSLLAHKDLVVLVFMCFYF